MVLKCRMIGEYVEWVARQSQNIGWVLLVLKSRMVGECIEWVARFNHYVGRL